MRVASGLVGKLPRQARWAVPAGAVAAVGLVVAGSAIAGAQSAPQLPARTTAQLLAAVDAPSAMPSAMTAVVEETASLGLPDLPGSSDPLSPLSFLSGSHTFRIWSDGPARVRIAIPVTLGETDIRRDGRDVWLWDSQTNQATHYVLPAQAGQAGASDPGTASASITAPTPTPQQAARELLAAVGATTAVGLQDNVTVAGQAAYQLSLAPRDSRSLIGQVRIAIDARDSLPLRVQVFARGASSPAFGVGYTSLSFARPAASNFAFSPPPGAKVKTITLPADGELGGPGPAFPGLLRPGPAIRNLGNSGGGFVRVAVPQGAVPRRPPNGKVPSGAARPVQLPASAGPGQVPALPAAVRERMVATLMQQLPASLTKAQRAKARQSIERGLASAPSAGTGTWIAVAPLAGPQASVPVVSGSAGPRVMGRGWLSVVVLPAGGISPAGPGPGIGASGLGSALLGAASPVHGSWGSGRLLRTSLVSVLITGSGEVLIGAVQPSVLYADAAQLS